MTAFMEERLYMRSGSGRHARGLGTASKVLGLCAPPDGKMGCAAARDEGSTQCGQCSAYVGWDVVLLVSGSVWSSMARWNGMAWDGLLTASAALAFTRDACRDRHDSYDTTTYMSRVINADSKKKIDTTLFLTTSDGTRTTPYCTITILDAWRP